MSTSPTRCCHSGLVRLATLNVFGSSGNWSDRLVVLRNGFLALDADLVTLQETMVREEVDQAAAILGPGFQLAHASQREANGSGITTATRWPLGRVVEVDLHVTERTHEFACTCLVTEILAPHPYGRIWLANHLPDYQVDHERERRLQAVTVARALDALAAEEPGHVIVAGDMDADEAADSIRFWTGRHVIDDLSVCYRNAWESARPTESLNSFVPDNPLSTDWDWPFRSIDHAFVRCAAHGGPTLPISDCRRVFDQPPIPSDHYGLIVELDAPPRWPLPTEHPDT
jgi:endonuclease/exonuclease/phosphatase family metal-dependent hydrolase